MLPKQTAHSHVHKVYLFHKIMCGSFFISSCFASVFTVNEQVLFTSGVVKSKVLLLHLETFTTSCSCQSDTICLEQSTQFPWTTESE